jgi:RNA-directed DNA polymerase
MKVALAVRPEGANHQWRKTPPGELSIYLEADKRLDRVTGWAEPLVEACFHEGSYGYRPGKSALDAVGVARQRCWRYARVLDLDLQSFFDQIVSKLLMRVVRKHTDCPWVLLYIERWLQAPVQMEDGSLARERGTPQGGW